MPCCRWRATIATRSFEREEERWPGPWLAHCEGLLAVRAGRLGRRLLLVRGDEVAFIAPRAKRIWLRSPTTMVGTEAG